MLKIRYHNGNPVAIKIDNDGWICREPYSNKLDESQLNRLDEFFNQVLSRAIRYQEFLDNQANRLDGKRGNNELTRKNIQRNDSAINDANCKDG